MNSYSYN
ncbi:uncharacterized protein FFE2_01690 [Fusarium fujikuroi]|nr:uncharacterized protein FFE2_01690 [Fusarium fujikuroi]